MKKFLGTADTFHFVINVISILYITGISLYLLWHRAWFSPDQFFAAAIIGAIIAQKIQSFFKDWIPFLMLFLSYEYLRGVIPLLHGTVNIFPMIQIDTLLFGNVPTILFQQMFYKPQNPQWYDFIAITIYISHFIAPMITAYIFWLTDKRIFKLFTSALIILSYAAFITFILYPAMPPWMASNAGHIPPIEKVMDSVMVHFGSPVSMPTIYSLFRSNDVAAMPSLHASFPLLIFLFMVKRFKWFGLLLIPYVAFAWFAVVYLGEHYVIDILVGALYTVIVFTIVTHHKKILQSTRKALKIIINQIHPPQVVIESSQK